MDDMDGVDSVDGSAIITYERNILFGEGDQAQFFVAYSTNNLYLIDNLGQKFIFYILYFMYRGIRA